MNQLIACRGRTTQRTEVINLPHRDRQSYYAFTPDIYGLYELICPSSVTKPPFFVYCSCLFVNGAGAQKRVAGRIAKTEMSVLTFGSFRRTARVDSVERLSFSRLDKECG